MLAILVVSSMPAHAGLKEMTKNSFGYILKKVGDNPGWLAYAALAACTYKSLVCTAAVEGNTEEENKFATKVAAGSLGIAAASAFIAYVCSWCAKKI